MALVLTGELRKRFEELEKQGLAEARDQYSEAEKYWLTSTADEEKARRAFVTAYDEPLFKLAEYRNTLQGKDRAMIDAYMFENGYTDMFNDYAWMRMDKKYNRANQVSFYSSEKDLNKRNNDNKRLDDRHKTFNEGFSKSEVDFRSQYVGPSPLDDPTLTDAQKKGLKDFHKWLYRNCDKNQGFFLMGGQGGVRAFAEEFMKKPASVQLKTLYLIETNNRKQKDNAYFDFESQTSYAPNLDNLKDKMIANKFKFWKKASGNYFYWDKLKDSLSMAEAGQEKLEAFRKEQNELLSDISKKKDKAGLQEYRNLFEARAAVKFLNQSKNIGEIETNMKAVQNNKDEKSLNALKNSLEGMKGLEKPVPVNKKKTKREIFKNISSKVGEYVGEVKSLDYKLKTTGEIIQGYHGIGTDDQKHHISAFANLMTNNSSIQNGVSLGCKIGSDSMNAISAVTGAIGNVFKIEAAAKKHGITTTADRVSAGAGITVGVMSNINALVKSGFKGAQYIVGKTSVISKASDLFPYISAGVGALGMVSGLVGMHASSKRIENFQKVLDDTTVKDERLKNLAALGQKLSMLDKERSALNMCASGAGAALGLAGILATGMPILSPVIAAGGIAVGVAKDAYDKQVIERNKNRLIVDNELLGGENGLKDKVKNFSNKLTERLKRYKEGSKQYNEIKAMMKNQTKLEDRIREDRVAKDGNLHISDNAKKQMKKIAKEIFAEIYYVDPKNKENPEYITSDNYKVHYKENTDEHRKRTSYQELFRGFKIRGKNFEKLTKKSDVIELENKIMKNM